ncbi:hypothetical protein ACFVJ8_23555 [Streptomyces yangpuensis]|uniref:hypothetical protein n=1 Tax=Streptomyces TaxID=1883 RepID=UPI0004CA2B9E|nr:hypothetical protein [Streptomyces sp. NRRL S-378]
MRFVPGISEDRLARSGPVSDGVMSGSAVAPRLLVRGQAAGCIRSTGKVHSDVNAVDTVALALLVTTVVSVVAIDVFRARVRLPGPGSSEREAGEPSAGRRSAATGARPRRFTAIPTGGEEQLWGSV